ncbi:MAG TPA: DUF1800 domain-containing protein [Gemmatimonadaceae bacterium]|nr:DUF1800 domain-containing protein [Gemmatimonadaceae bacterium]
MHSRFRVVAAAFVALPTVALSQRELTPAEQVSHAVARLTFGARPGDLARVSAIGVDKWIEQQLRPESISDRDAEHALRGLTPWWGDGTDERKLATVYYSSFKDASGMMRMTRVPQSEQFGAGKIIRAQLSERQLLEVITDFWENHFSVYAGKMPSAGALFVWNRSVIRPRALGKFRDLLGAVAKSPAMLYYLDNYESTRFGINENYARELLELHTLGVDGGYTQDDVINVARALTGWTFDPRLTLPVRVENIETKFVFRRHWHDTSEKTVLGHVLPAGGGIDDGERVLDIVASHPSTAKFIALKLARRFVSDTPPAALVERAAMVFTCTDGDIAEVVRTIVTSDEFFARAAFRAKVKTPFEFIVSAKRALNAPADTTPTSVRALRELGQPLFGKDTPEGWPDYADAWMSSGAMLKRVMLASDASDGKLNYMPVSLWRGWMPLSGLAPEQQADGVVQYLLGGTVYPATLKTLRAAEGENGRDRLREMIAIALGSPEFQRR